MWLRLRDRIGPVLRSVGPFLVIATALGLGAAELDFPDGSMWDEASDGLVIGTIAAVAGSSVYGVFKFFDDRTAARADELRHWTEELERECREAFIPINECLSAVPIGRIGLHIWRVAPNGSRLVLVHTYAMEQKRFDPPFVWTPGRGTVGMAWLERAVRIDVGISSKVALARSTDGPTFNALPPGDRLGLEHADLVRGGPYEAILAIPVLAAEPGPGAGDPPVAGMVSVDSLQDVRVDDFRALLGNLAFRKFLGFCQGHLWKLPPSEHPDGRSTVTR